MTISTTQQKVDPKKYGSGYDMVFLSEMPETSTTKPKVGIGEKLAESESICCATRNTNPYRKHFHDENPVNRIIKDLTATNSEYALMYGELTRIDPFAADMLKAASVVITAVTERLRK